MFDCVEKGTFNKLAKHVVECTSNHIYFLTGSVISKYLNIRMHFISKKHSEIADPIRNKLTKLILFKGQ